MAKWTALQELERRDEEFHAGWMVAVPLLEDVTHLQIEANGRWTGIFGLAEECGVDGLPRLPIDSSHLPIAAAPVGALIGKLGGSSAAFRQNASAEAQGEEPAEDRPFAIGSRCVVQVPKKSVGPLFISFNCHFRPIQIVRLSVTASAAIINTE